MKINGLSLVLFLFVFQTAFSFTPSWLRYTSISPDGEYVLFNYDGDIYKVPSFGGVAIQITNNDSYDYHGIWSKDGSQIAFVSDRNGNDDIFVVPSNGGKSKQLTFHSRSEVPFCFDKNGSIYFGANLLDDSDNVQFPSRGLPELYKIDSLGAISQVLTISAEDVSLSENGKSLFFHNRKGYEDVWRKHHVSSVTRDIWKYNFAEDSYEKLIGIPGEDRNPVPHPNEESLYFLSERNNSSFNVWKSGIAKNSEDSQITNFKTHPVRFLSVSDQGKLCFAYDGDVYTMIEGEKPQKIQIEISGEISPRIKWEDVSSEVTELTLSKDNKEIAFVARGDVFVTSTDYSDTRQITNTPQQERSVEFSPDGKKLIYAGERNGSWNIYETSRNDESVSHFFLSAVNSEKLLIGSSENDEFRPVYSPDGKYVAFLENRMTLKVYNTGDKSFKTVLAEKYNYSYTDEDVEFSWSPDSKWIASQFLPVNRWQSNIALINIESGKIIDVTESGYYDGTPKFAMDGKMLIYSSNRHGMRSHGSWGSEGDIYGIFLDPEAWDQFQLPESEFGIMIENQKKKKEKDKLKDKTNAENKGKNKDKTKEEEPVVLNWELENLSHRRVRLTPHSSDIFDAVLSKNGDKLYYLSQFEKDYDLYVHDFKKKETKRISKTKNKHGQIILDNEEKNIYILSEKKLMKVNIESAKATPIEYSCKKQINFEEEYAYIFNHSWRQCKEKFYVTDMHGVDWEFMKKEYSKFLPHIGNDRDFCDMLGEMLGELNASHTGGKYRSSSKGVETASLGIMIDYDFTGKGVRISGFLSHSPLLSDSSRIKSGDIITSVNGETVSHAGDLWRLLDHRNAQSIQISYSSEGKKLKQYVRPYSLGDEGSDLYERWVESREDEVEKLSNGQLGYVHVRGMNDESFRVVYEKALGKYQDRKALIVDTRFNGGGWLHDDLVTFLSGKAYASFVPRGREIGLEPLKKWYKPSAVVVSESNYSDAHGFPFAYRANEVGKVVGMPVPGTMTAVWWERQINPNIIFGIPQVGVADMEGNLQENRQFEPDVVVDNDYNIVTKGRDQQLEECVKLLLQEVGD